MSQKHSTPVRGLLGTKDSPLFQGRFGRMFQPLPHARFGSTEQENVENLAKLGSAMSADFDGPKDGKDDEESGIPALYTYLGQFIDHDITFDPASSLQKQNDPDALIDFRTPAFDLDNVYGRGPDDQPYLYDGDRSFCSATRSRAGRRRGERSVAELRDAGPRAHRRSSQRREQHRLAVAGPLPAVPQSICRGARRLVVRRGPTSGPVPLPVRRPSRLPAAGRRTPVSSPASRPTVTTTRIGSASSTGGTTRSCRSSSPWRPTGSATR